MANFCTKCGNPLYLCTCEDKNSSRNSSISRSNRSFSRSSNRNSIRSSRSRRERDRFAQSAASPLKNASATKEPILI